MQRRSDAPASARRAWRRAAVAFACVLLVGGAADARSKRDRPAPERAPRIVLPAFVVRCSTLPDEEPFRVARPSYCVNEAGEAIGEPGADPPVPALEPIPELQWEAFDAYWRKIHGPKIIHDDGPDDRVTRLLLRYEQQHRIPGGPTTQFAPPYPPQVDEDGLLVTDPHTRVPPYEAPDFDGLAQLAFADRDDFFAFFGIEPGDKYLEKIIPDERVFLKGFAFNISEEHVIIRDRGVRDPIILIKTLERAPELSREEFQALWLTKQAHRVASDPLARRLVGRYAQLHNVSTPADGAFYDPVGDRFDVVEVYSFPNTGAVERFVASDTWKALEEAEAEHTVRTRYFTAVNYVIRNVDPRETNVDRDGHGIPPGKHIGPPAERPERPAKAPHHRPGPHR